MVEAHLGLLNQRGRLPGQLRIAGRRILYLEQFLWEAAEIVDGLRLRHGGDVGAARQPMSGDTEDGLGLGDLPPQLRPAAAELIVLDPVHG